jgi:hypothetical protein
MHQRRLRTAALAAFLLVAASGEATAAPFQVGEFVTYSQESWGGDPNVDPAVQLLVNQFGSVYGGGIEVGLPINTGWSIIVTSALAVLNYLPSSGPPGPLTADLVDPTSTSSGLFGGSVLALQFNVDFSDGQVLILLET